MPSSTLLPDALWPAIVRRTAHALERGALRPIETVSITVEDGGVPFIVRQVSSLARKARERVPPSSDQAPADPFLPYDPDLFVANVTQTHVALLNKFNVIEHHLLVVTRAFEEQQALLNLDDFTAWLACLAQFESVGFYNSGRQAGASQRHKHMQLVPLPLHAAEPAKSSLPIEPVLSRALAQGAGADAGTLAGLPFPHAFTAFAPAATTSDGAAEVHARDVHARYLRLLDALALRLTNGTDPARQTAPYNLLLTSRWMLMVPRVAECADAISVNALGFAGSLFVRDAAQMEIVKRLGPMAILRRVAGASTPREET
jgi:ATP adenylyltransferase